MQSNSLSKPAALLLAGLLVAFAQTSAHANIHRTDLAQHNTHTSEAASLHHSGWDEAVTDDVHSLDLHHHDQAAIHPDAAEHDGAAAADQHASAAGEHSLELHHNQEVAGTTHHDGWAGLHDEAA